MTKTPEVCSICGCTLNRSGNYARATVEGRAHASKHHFVAERFFGRSANRRGTTREGIFESCPWGHEGEGAIYCYECHEELLHNPVLLPEDVLALSELVRCRDLHEQEKPNHKERIAGRVRLLHEVIACGINTLLEAERAEAKRR